MDQISPPIRIVLGVAIVFLAAWMLVLKPKNDSGSKAAATPVATAAPATASASDGNTASTGLGRAVEAAHGASDKTAAADQANGADPATGATNTGTSAAGTASAPSTSSATGVKPSSTATGTETTATDPALAKLPTWLQNNIDHKVIALLFVNNKAADDQRTAKSLKRASTFGGKVVKRTVPVSEVSKYRSIAQGVDVTQSPTLVVIDRNRVASTITGYSNTGAVNQAIIDGMLATNNPVKHVKYLQTVKAQCDKISQAVYIGPTVGDNMAQVKQNMDRQITVFAAAQSTLKKAPVPAGYKPLGKLVNKYMTTQIGIKRQIRDVAFKGKAVDTVKVDQLVRSVNGTAHDAILALAGVGVDNCS